MEWGGRRGVGVEGDMGGIGWFMVEMGEGNGGCDWGYGGLKVILRLCGGWRCAWVFGYLNFDNFEWSCVVLIGFGDVWFYQFKSFIFDFVIKIFDYTYHIFYESIGSLKHDLL